jgi:hypothetical protein
VDQKFGGPNVTHQAHRGGLNVTVTFSPPSIWGCTKSYWTHHYRVQKATWTKRFWDPVSLGLNVRVELSLGPKVGGLNVKAPKYPLSHLVHMCTLSHSHSVCILYCPLSITHIYVIGSTSAFTFP